MLAICATACMIFISINCTLSTCVQFKHSFVFVTRCQLYTDIFFALYQIPWCCGFETVRYYSSVVEIGMLWRKPGFWFNIKMSSYQYKKSRCGDKMILRPSYVHNGISYTGKTTSWIGTQYNAMDTYAVGSYLGLCGGLHSVIFWLDTDTALPMVLCW